MNTSQQLRNLISKQTMETIRDLEKMIDKLEKELALEKERSASLAKLLDQELRLISLKANLEIAQDATL